MNDNWRDSIRAALLKLPATVKMTEIARETGVTKAQIYALRHNRAMSADALKRIERWLLDAGRLNDPPRAPVSEDSAAHRLAVTVADAQPRYSNQSQPIPHRPVGAGLFLSDTGIPERQCPYCGQFSPHNWDDLELLFCGHCGQPLGIECPQCNDVIVNWQPLKCTRCNADLVPPTSARSKTTCHTPLTKSPPAPPSPVSKTSKN